MSNEEEATIAGKLDRCKRRDDSRRAVPSLLVSRNRERAHVRSHTYPHTYVTTRQVSHLPSFLPVASRQPAIVIIEQNWFTRETFPSTRGLTFGAYFPSTLRVLALLIRTSFYDDDDDTSTLGVWFPIIVSEVITFNVTAAVSSLANEIWNIFVRVTNLELHKRLSLFTRFIANEDISKS